MFIFSATAVAKPGKGMAAADYMRKARGVVVDATGLDANAWQAVMGAPLGSLAISVRVETMGALIEGQAKLAESAAYAALQSEAGDLMSAPTDTLLNRIVAASGEPGDPAPIMSVTTVTVGGSYSKAVEFGVKVMEHVTSVTGNAGVVTLSEGPAIGELTWLFGSASPAAVDESDAKLQADADYLGLYDQAAELFVPGSARRAMIAQIN